MLVQKEMLAAWFRGDGIRETEQRERYLGGKNQQGLMSDWMCRGD